MKSLALLVTTTLIAFAVTSPSHAQLAGGFGIDRAQEQKMLSNVKQIALACRLFAIDSDGKMPTELEALVDDQLLPDTSILTFRDKPSADERDWIYFGEEMIDSSRGRLILIASPPSENGRRVVAMIDGSAAIMHEREYQVALAANEQAEPAKADENDAE